MKTLTIRSLSASLFILVLVAAGASQARRTVTLDVRAADPGDRLLASAPQRTWFVATDASQDEIEALRVRLKEAGARSINLVMPDGVIVCELPQSGAPSLTSGLSGFRVWDEREIGPQTVSSLGRPIGWMLDAHRNTDAKFFGGGKQRSAAPTPVPPFEDVVVQLSPERLREAQREIDAALALRPGPWPVAAQDRRAPNQNSEVLGGDIAAQFVFPQSNGTYEGVTETWTDNDLVVAKQGAYEMMLEWQGHFRAMDINVTYYMVDKDGGGEVRSGGTWAATCDYEPIQHNMNDDELWVLNVTQHAFPTITQGVDDAIGAAHLVNEWRRSRGYDWAFTAYVARSRNAPLQRFKDANYTAYANLGGPYLVQPFPSGVDFNSIGERAVYSQILNHEGGHIFWTLDEYPGAPGNCANTSGYLRYANMNISIVDPFNGSTTRCQDLVTCIMHVAAREDDWGVGLRPWCSWSLGQMAVIDDNSNGVPDVFEAAPIVEFAIEGPETLTTNDVTISFRARANAVPNNNPAFGHGDNIIDYASGVGDAFLTLGGSGARVDLTPLDGGWGGEATEDFEFRMQLGTVGQTSIAVQTKNRAGFQSRPYYKEVYFIGVNYGKMDVAVYEGAIGLGWEVVGEDFGATYTLYRLAPGEELPGVVVAADVQPSGPSVGGFTPYRVADRNVDPGVSYRYYVDGRFTLDFQGSSREYYTESPTATATAMLKIAAGAMVSAASPNPFREQVSVSVSIPATYRDASAGAQQFQQRVATDVTVDVYDVAGRKVRNLDQSSRFSAILTLSWDGRDRNGNSVPSGVYFIRASAAGATGVTKVLLLR